MKKRFSSNIFFTILLIISILGVPHGINAEPQLPSREYLVTAEEPLNFRIYSSAEISLLLNYTIDKSECLLSAYEIFHNNEFIFTTMQNENQYIPLEQDTTIIYEGLYSIFAGTLGLDIKDTEVGYDCTHMAGADNIPQNTELLVSVKCLENDCFMDPTMLQMQQQQEAQNREQQQQEQEAQQQMQQQRELELNNNDPMPQMNFPVDTPGLGMNF
ncbi:MAG: hypothetical protein ACOCQR_03635 [bacterium]